MLHLFTRQTRYTRATFRSLATHANNNNNHDDDDDNRNRKKFRPPSYRPTTFTAAGAFSFAALPFLPTTTTTATAAMINSNTTTSSSLLATSAATATTLSPAVLTFLKVFPPLAAQACFFAPLQAMKQFKKDGTTGDVAPIPYTAMCINGIVWVAYGALLGEPTIWAPNISAFCFGAYYVYQFNLYKAPHVNMTPQYAAIAIAAAATGGLCIGLPDDAGFIIGHCAIVIVAVMFGGPLASISTVLKDKSTKSLPFAFTVATLVNCVAWSSYGIFVIDDYIVWLPNMLGLAAAIAQLGLFAKFGIHKDENNALVDDPENPKKM